MKQKHPRPSHRLRKGAVAQPLCCAYFPRLVNPAKSIFYSTFTSNFQLWLLWLSHSYIMVIVNHGQSNNIFAKKPVFSPQIPVLFVEPASFS